MPQTAVEPLESSESSDSRTTLLTSLFCSFLSVFFFTPACLPLPVPLFQRRGSAHGFLDSHSARRRTALQLPAKTPYLWLAACRQDGVLLLVVGLAGQGKGCRMSRVCVRVCACLCALCVTTWNGLPDLQLKKCSSKQEVRAEFFYYPLLQHKGFFFLLLILFRD